jgi:hypothetical protein
VRVPSSSFLVLSENAGTDFLAVLGGRGGFGLGGHALLRLLLGRRLLIHVDLFLLYQLDPNRPIAIAKFT